MKAYAGHWLITGRPEDAPIARGAVVFSDDDRVLAVGDVDALRSRFPQAQWTELPCLLLPGLVNAHVHLELSALRGQTTSGGGFGPWATSMMAARERLLPEQDFEAIDAGVGELLRSGTAAVGEVSNTLASVGALRTAPLLGCVFHEVFGLRRETAALMRQSARDQRAAQSPWPAQLRYAPAPHTLFSVHPAAVRGLVDEAQELSQRTSLHLCEHAAERAYLTDQRGPLQEFFRARGADDPDWEAPGVSPVDYAEQLGVLRPGVIAVHLCDARRSEIARVARSGAPVVLCPRSNLFIELKLPPLPDILAEGIQPGLGTDSLASNTTLDVLAEAAALRDRFSQVEPELLLSMATHFGARALGLEDRVGALVEGLSPGLVAIDCPADARAAAHVLRHPTAPRQVPVRPSLKGLS